jgi:tRNA threonylcarbamoyladenosine biosynthesis protein TsaB
MAILALDTATHILAAAIGNGDKLLASSAILVPRGHSRLLHPTLDYLLKSADVKAAELSGITVGIGPGSYTGVRMGVTTAKAMAMALNIPVMPVSTLTALAEATVSYSPSKSTLITSLLYARRQRAFGAIYVKLGEALQTLVPAQVRSVTEWADATIRLQHEAEVGQTVVVHDFVPKYEVLSVFETLSLDGLVHMDQVAGAIGPALCRIGQDHPDPLVGDRLHQLVPDYALRVEAEVNLANKGGSARGTG